MWVLLRLLTAAAVGLYKFFQRRTRFSKKETTGGVSWVYTLTRTKGRVTGMRFGVPFQHPVFFRLSRESRLDRFFKSVDFSRETQTGDVDFDAKVYVACDHPALAPLLQANADLRNAIKQLLTQGGGKKIHADGSHLWVDRDGDLMPGAEGISYLVEIRDALAQIPKERLQVLRDPFVRRAFLVEALVWSAACYGLPGLFEKVTRKHPLYFDWQPVITTGLAMALVLFVFLFGLARTLLRGSSRAHRVLIESAVVLALGVSLSSIDMVSDLNTALDSSPPTLVQRTVRAKYTHVTRGRRGSSRVQYHLQLANEPTASKLTPDDIEVSHSLYEDARNGGALTIVRREGALHLPWVENITASLPIQPVERAK